MSNSESTIQKRCSRCRQTYPATLEYFYGSKTSRDGFQHYCKTCESARKRDRLQWLHHPDNAEQLLQHKLAQRESDLRRYANHRDECRAMCRRYHANHAELVRERKRQYRIEKPEQQYHIKYPDRQRESIQRWRENNRDKRRVEKLLRRAAGSVTKEDIIRLRESQKGCCAYCGQMLQKGKTHVDHIRPISKGGRSDRDNLCLACAKCNIQKHNKTPEEWVRRWYQDELKP